MKKRRKVWIQSLAEHTHKIRDFRHSADKKGMNEHLDEYNLIMCSQAY